MLKGSFWLVSLMNTEDAYALKFIHMSPTLALTAQRHEEAVSQSGGQIRGGDDHCVWAHSMQEVHDLQRVSE